MYVFPTSLCLSLCCLQRAGVSLHVPVSPCSLVVTGRECHSGLSGRTGTSSCCPNTLRLQLVSPLLQVTASKPLRTHHCTCCAIAPVPRKALCFVYFMSRRPMGYAGPFVPHPQSLRASCRVLHNWCSTPAGVQLTSMWASGRSRNHLWSHSHPLLGLEPFSSSFLSMAAGASTTNRVRSFGGRGGLLCRAGAASSPGRGCQTVR